jgi:hypothetical protein
MVCILREGMESAATAGATVTGRHGAIQVTASGKLPGFWRQWGQLLGQGRQGRGTGGSAPVGTGSDSQQP